MIDRHNLRISELCAMNNLMSSGIFGGMQLRVRRKQRSQSLPVLPFAERMEQEGNDSGGDAQQQQKEVETEREHQQQQPETSPRSYASQLFLHTSMTGTDV